MIRKARLQDLPCLAALDRAAYGEYGVNKRYFRQKLISPNATILVAQSHEHITGFVVFEVMKPDQELEDFYDLQITKPLSDAWMHIIAFTTITNFKDALTDAKLLHAAEEKARALGCSTFCVPLTINHPYPDAFGFFEANGYRRAGTITWNASPTEAIDCYFYTKSAENTF